MNVRDGEIDYKLSKERSKEAIIINSFIQLEKDMRKKSIEWSRSSSSSRGSGGEWKSYGRCHWALQQ